MSNYKVTVLGAGLAGCEAALWLAGRGVQVELYEQKPAHFSPAHKSEGFAELICSNSLKAERLDSASGLLKEEMRRMGSQLLNAAETARVAAGGALAVDRDAFSAEVTRMVESCAPKFAYLLVDAPALSECSDALSLAKVCDGALLVVQSGGVTHQELRQAAHLLQGCGLPLLGTVLNRTPY